MLSKNKIDKTITRIRKEYKKSSKEARREIGKVISGDVRSERKTLNSFKRF